MENVTRNPLVVYTIVERGKDGKKFWVRIGSAFRNQDGSLNARLDAVPVNGTMHIRELRTGTGASSAWATPETDLLEGPPR
jgi:hypothetical protein